MARRGPVRERHARPKRAPFAHKSTKPPRKRRLVVRSVVSRVLCRSVVAPAALAIIRLGIALPRSSSSLPRGIGRAVLERLPTWPCFGWGLPCRWRHRQRGGLLPHRFTLTPQRAFRRAVGRSVLCGTILGVTPTGRYPASCPVKLGLSSRVDPCEPPPAITFPGRTAKP